MKSEKVFEILGEGGGVEILRTFKNGKNIFTYHHSEFDPTDETDGVNEKFLFDSFEEPFQLIHQKYPWHLLHLNIIHKDYHHHILEKLSDKFNSTATPVEELPHSVHKLEEILNIQMELIEGERWMFYSTDSKALRMWNKSSISFENYQNFIRQKNNRFQLTLIDLFFVSNFKGGNATIHEPEKVVNRKLEEYSKALQEIELVFPKLSLAALNDSQLNSLIALISDVLELTSKEKTRIDGFGASYLSALLNAYFPNLIPILDRRVLINHNIVTEQDINSQGQIKNIQQFYEPLILKVAEISRNSDKSIREIDQKYFSRRLPNLKKS